jgi:hypothetical protein
MVHGSLPRFPRGSEDGRERLWRVSKPGQQNLQASHRENLGSVEIMTMSLSMSMSMSMGISRPGPAKDWGCSQIHSRAELGLCVHGDPLRDPLGCKRNGVENIEIRAQSEGVSGARIRWEWDGMEWNGIGMVDPLPNGIQRCAPLVVRRDLPARMGAKMTGG